MDSNTPPQIDSERPDINDSQKSTRGGPPLWLAITILGGVFVVGVIVLFAVMAAG
ncbi:MAG: hypothetical protein AAGG38_05980 [Planctomycetota bacterium]